MEKPTRALYICDENCTSTCDGCYLVRNEKKYTTSVVHAKNGPVVNYKEYDQDFTIEEVNGMRFYVEKGERKDASTSNENRDIQKNEKREPKELLSSR